MRIQMKKIDDLYENWGNLGEWERIIFTSFLTVCKGDIPEALREYREFFESIEEDESCQEGQDRERKIPASDGSSQYSFDF